MAKRKRRNPEERIHLDVCEQIRVRGKRGLVWWHTPNGGKRWKREAAKLKRMGVRAGVSDLCFVHRSSFFALELKAPKGRETAAQSQFALDVINQGGVACTVRGFNEAIRILEIWGLLEGEMQ